MIASMDLNASPEPEEDEVFPEPQSEEDNVLEEHVDYNEHVSHGESAVQISRRVLFCLIMCEYRIEQDSFRFFLDNLHVYAHFLRSVRKGFNGYEGNALMTDHPMGINQLSVMMGIKQKDRDLIVNFLQLGLVIDLTNSSRYYNFNEWKKEGIKHVKIACKGRDSVPDNESVNKFFYEVSRSVISSSVRSEIMPDMVVCPPTPEWKRSSDLDLNGDALPDDDDDDGDSAAPLDESQETQLVMTNDDILGDKVPSDQEVAMRQFCYQSLKLPAGVRGPQQFPGSHPVSLNRDNLQLLRQRYYYATWKADGTRYMMLITMDGCYLIDRHFNFRRVQMRFPCRHANEGMAEKMYHHFTLLDGEMVIDTMPDSQKQERRYLIYDMMAINQVSIVERPFYERWKMLEKEVIEPRNIERQHIYQSQNPYYRYDLEPFRVRRKDFWLLSTVTKLLKGFIPKLSHAADGLIFQGWDDPYVPRTHEGLLKWKYPEMNSVDFLFEMVDDRQSLFLFERGKKKLMDGNRVVFPDGADPSSYSGKIVECSWDSEEDVWVCMRVRTDKGTPNEFNTYKKVMRSIRDNITEDILLNEINEIIRLPMYADRIQNESKAHQHNSSRRR
ncbi:UNVERIFIED_CONTAM: capping enzyme [Sesamum calycinum]|uniref:mRNA guanylyltransferase n=1 Tax=Sesamum calycinum TaxID=2727403 RepID=A0AAW2MZS7_9LAMI